MKRDATTMPPPRVGVCARLCNRTVAANRAIRFCPRRLPAIGTQATPRRAGVRPACREWGAQAASADSPHGSSPPDRRCQRVSCRRRTGQPTRRSVMVNASLQGGIKSCHLCHSHSGSACLPPGCRMIAVERAAPVSNVDMEKGRVIVSFSTLGDGAGNAVLQQKIPRPDFNF